GIRDSSVTGVQTCALPIYGALAAGRSAALWTNFIRPASCCCLYQSSCTSAAVRASSAFVYPAQFGVAGAAKIVAQTRATLPARKIGRAAGRERVEMCVGAW